MAQPKSFYEADFLAWSQQQAEALRAAAHTGSNRHLEWENLAEEVEDLGRSIRRELQSQLRRIVHHLLKLEYSSAKDPRRGWEESIVDARAEIEDLLETSPSLKAMLKRDLDRQMQRGIVLALRDLERHGKVAAATTAALRAAVYTEEEVLGDWFPAERSGDLPTVPSV